MRVSSRTNGHRCTRSKSRTYGRALEVARPHVKEAVS